MGSWKLSRNEIESLSGKYIVETNKVHILIQWANWFKEFIAGFGNQNRYGLYNLFFKFIYAQTFYEGSL